MCPPPHRGFGLGRAVPPPQKFYLNVYIKIASFRAFLVAISYRLADCFTRIGNTRGIEIYWPSFQHFGNYRPITPCGKLSAKK